MQQSKTVLESPRSYIVIFCIRFESVLTHMNRAMKGLKQMQKVHVPNSDGITNC